MMNRTCAQARLGRGWLLFVVCVGVVLGARPVVAELPARDEVAPGAVVQPSTAQPPAAQPSAAQGDPLIPVDAWQPWQGDTVAWQLLGGVGGGAIGGVAGGALGAVLADGSSGEWAFLAGAILGATLGVTVGTGVGVAVVGNLSGGNGNGGWTILAGVAGTIVGGAVGSSVSGDDAAIGMLAGALVGGAIGGIVGYHLTASTVAGVRPQAALLTRAGDRLVFGAPALRPYRARDGRVDGATLTLLGVGW